MARAEKQGELTAPNIEILATEIEQWPIDRLTPYANNARVHSDEQIEKLAEAITSYGWTIPCLVDETGELIAGHGRLLAGQKLGIETVPVIVAKGWSDQKKRAYTIADNRLGELSGWDTAILAINKELHLEGDYSIDVENVEIDDVELLDAVKPEEIEWSKAKKKRDGAPLENDKSRMLTFGRRRIPVSQTELDWLVGQINIHLRDYGMAMGFVEQTLKASSVNDAALESLHHDG